MALITNLKIKIFYFEMEISQQQAYLNQKGLDASLKAVEGRLCKLTSELYLKSNLQVTGSSYEQSPFRLSVTMEGSEYKQNEAVNISDGSAYEKEKFTVLVGEIINYMSSQVKYKITQQGYKVDEIAAQIILQIWNLKYRSNPKKQKLLRYFSKKHGSCNFRKLYFNSNHSVINDILF